MRSEGRSDGGRKGSRGPKRQCIRLFMTGRLDLRSRSCIEDPGKYKNGNRSKVEVVDNWRTEDINKDINKGSI